MRALLCSNTRARDLRYNSGMPTDGKTRVCRALRDGRWGTARGLQAVTLCIGIAVLFVVVSCARSGFDFPPDASTHVDAADGDLSPADDSSALDAEVGVDTVVSDGHNSDAVVRPFAISSFEVGYATPNVAYIEWWPEGVPSDFAEYELWYGTDRATVDSARGPARRWGREQDLNLAYLFRRAPQTISRTMVLGLEPETEYFAMLRAVSSTDTVLARTDVVGFTTPAEPTAAVVLYADAPVFGSWYFGESNGLPSSGITSSTVNPYSGTSALDVPVTLPPTPGFVIHYGGLNLSLPVWNEAIFDRAYLEFAVACTGGNVDYLDLTLSDAVGRILVFGSPGYYLCGPQYRVIQIPLTEMRDANDWPGAYDRFGGQLSQIIFWGPWLMGTVHIDEIRIRY